MPPPGPIPAPSIDSFAGVGYYFDLAAIQAGETVVDLGSGSGMDSCLAAGQVGADSRVIGVDMTDAQLEKATRLAGEHGLTNVDFRRGYIEKLPVDDGSADVVISNGVINLSPQKGGSSPQRRASCARAGGLRSPTSSRTPSSPKV